MPVSCTIHFTELGASSLHQRGYEFEPASYGFNFGAKGFSRAYHLENFSALFLNDYLIRCGLESSANFRYCFGDSKYVEGDFSRLSSLVMDDVRRDNIPLDEADDLVVKVFLSSETTSSGRHMPRIYEVPLVREQDVVGEVPTSNQKVALRVYGADDPFYYVLSVGQIREGDVRELPSEWADLIERYGYSYHFDSDSGLLAIGNTMASRYGLPPNCRDLRLPRLRTELVCDDLDVSVKSRKANRGAKTKNLKLSKKAEPTTEAQQGEATPWQTDLGRLFNSGKQEDFSKLKGNGMAWTAFHNSGLKIQDIFDMSPHAIKRFKRTFMGKENALAGEDFVRLIAEKFSDEYARLSLILRWAPIIVWSEGKVYIRDDSVDTGAS